MADQEKIKEAVRLFLEGIGEDPDREGLKETPDRVARMCEELFAGIGQQPDAVLQKRFFVSHSEMVLERDIPFYSVCEHHLVPFFGKVHIAYLPKGQVVGLSKLARVVELFARRPQIQERMTEQIADALMGELGPEGVMVIISAEHLCMAMRGVKKPGSVTETYAVRGAFSSDASLQDRVFAMTQKKGERDADCRTDL